MIIDNARELIHSSNHIVVFSGVGLTIESNIPNFSSPQECYIVEDKFGYSPEDIYSSVFYNTRPDEFFQYYKEHILYLDYQPNAAHYAISELEKQGKLTGIITRNIYGLHQMAGSNGVIELHGCIHRNYCTKCQESYSAAYLKHSLGIPYCEKCKSVIRPKVGLYGEKLDNGQLSRACKAVSEADLFLVVGTNLHSRLTEQFLRYFQGSNIILVNEEPHYTDEHATCVFNEKASVILPQFV